MPIRMEFPLFGVHYFSEYTSNYQSYVVEYTSEREDQSNSLGRRLLLDVLAANRKFLGTFAHSTFVGQTNEGDHEAWTEWSTGREGEYR